MFKNKKVMIGVGVTAIILLLFVFSKMVGGGVEVKAVDVKREKILSTVSASGMIEANSVNLGSAQMAGRVGWIGVKEGDRVQAGQILIKLEGYTQAAREYTRLLSLYRQGFVSQRDLEQAKLNMQNAAVTAPISGIVTEKAVTLGETVSPGMPVLTVVDIDNPWVEIQVDEVDIAKIKIGQRVRFTTDAYQEKEFFGTVTWINKEAGLKKVGGRVRMDEEDLIFRARVEFEDGSEVLKPNMSVYAEIITGEKDDVLTVPREAIALSAGKRVIYVISSSRVKLVEAELGLKDLEKVEILSGLKEGQKVAVSSLDKLKDGAKIKVIK
ncbi:MAG: efflux RND transporter periplasmic adaptor subunit [bacterium]|nr:efflux RND transporter periplasmic adaptor subunit [Candidatus Margulisiibacteriota bacterium]